jgi:hypothetical protein
MQADTIRLRRATGPKGSPSLTREERRPGFFGFSVTGAGGVTGGFSSATPPDFLSSLSLEFGIQSPNWSRLIPTLEPAFDKRLVRYFYLKGKVNVKKAKS